MRRRIGAGLGIGVLLLGAYIMLRARPIPVETYEVSRQTIREFITEDAKTRLADEYVVDMPISGTIERIRLEVGDEVKEGMCIARVDAFDVQKQIAGMEALIAQARAQMSGVDVQKPKPEDLAAAELRVKEGRDTEAMVAREYAAAEANFEAAQREYDRLSTLQAQGAVSQSQLDEARRLLDTMRANLDRLRLGQSAAAKGREIAELTAQSLRASVDDNEYMRDVYRAELESRQAQLEMLKKDVDETEVLSPVNGLVLEKFVEDQRVLVAGTPLLKLGDLSTVEIECDVLSEDVVRIQAGDPVEISGKALRGETAMGKVDRIYPAGFKKISALGIEQQRVRTIIAFDNRKISLRPETSVDVRIIIDERADALVVPERATFRNGADWAVFRIEGGKARLVPVTLGLKNDEWAEITAGLEQGQMIVAEPKNELVDGVRVTEL